VSSDSRLVEALRALSQSLREEDIRWYVFGAQATAAYGIPRLTSDIDVTVDVAPAHCAALIERLREHGFVARTAELEAVAARIRVIPVYHAASGFPVDLVLAGPGLEQEFLERARLIDLGGMEVPVLAAEDLVVTKILAGRPKDLGDVEGILRELAGELDLARSRALLALLEQALSRQDLLSELNRIVDRVTGEDS
jgi:predicted nucleotidyltransferase